MLKRVVEDYLESIKEVQFFIPFTSLLALKGYYDIHIIHGPTEFGKDIIAKEHTERGPTQCVFQLKAGDINMAKYRNEIQTQLFDATLNNLSHPNFDERIPKKVIFATTGTINPMVALALQEFSRRQLRNGLEPVLTVEKPQLVDDFLKYGLEPFFTLYDDPEFVGKFFDFYAKIKDNRPLDSFEIEEYTRRWLEASCINDIGQLQIFIEAYLFSALLLNAKRYYQASLVLAALARSLSKWNLYEQYSQTIVEYLHLIVTSLMTDLQTIYDREENLAGSASGGALLSIFRYPKLCLHSLELLSLDALLSDEPNTDIDRLTTQIIDRERGWERPLSDNYAASIALTGLFLLKNSDTARLKKLIINVTIWLCDRYDNIGLATFGSSEKEEFEQLLSEHLEGLCFTNNNTSFIASILLDLSYFLGDQYFYNAIANELGASSIITERFHVLSDAELYGYQDITSSFDPEFSREYLENYSSGISIEREKNKVTIRSPVLFFLLFLMRDRMFPTFIREML